MDTPTEKTAKNWFEEGNEFFNKKDYQEAIKCYEQATNIQSDYNEAWSKCGNAWFNLEEYQKTIDCCKKIVGNNSHDDQDQYYALNNIGVARLRLNEHEDAIKSFDEAIQKYPHDYLAFYNKGLSLVVLKKYQDAINSFNKACEKAGNSDAKKCQINTLYQLGIIYIKTKEYEQAAKYFTLIKADILPIMFLHEKDQEIQRDETKMVVKYMLNNKHSFFSETTKDVSEDVDKYKKIYLDSLEIINLLHVKKDEEGKIAHFTKQSTSKLLIFDESSKFRLNLITTSNDPREGKILLSFLEIEDTEKLLKDENYRAFVGCFTFNHNSLNQFRLYGKENNQEATGVSIVIKRTEYFSDVPISSTPLIQSDQSAIQHKLKSLCRCIYIDPKTGYIDSIGHREEYTFYKENNTTEHQERINNYQKSIKEILEKVRKGLQQLQNDTKGLDLTIVSKLLINLRYLVKHIAFKEEQECRVIHIAALERKMIKGIKRGLNQEREYDYISEITVDSNNGMYIDYLPIHLHVTKIYFGPKANGLELYRDMLRNEGMPHIECESSNLPFTG
jgi:tetratricopeptide (TPR) repeat protein